MFSKMVLTGLGVGGRGVHPNKEGGGGGGAEEVSL